MRSPHSFISTKNTREGSVSRIEKGPEVVSVNQNSISYQDFKSALFELSKLILCSTPEHPLDIYQRCLLFIKHLILPLTHQHNPQSSRLSEMLQMLESEDVISLLSELHGVIAPIYAVYASKRTACIDFQAFTRFLTDFSVFPDVVNKSEAYKIFMNLAFTQENPSHNEQFNFTRQSIAFDQ